MLGGGMRQAGVLAAAGLHALEHHMGRLADDHRRARWLATELAASPAFDFDPDSVETNLVFAPLERRFMAGTGDANSWERRLAESGVRCFAEGPARLRFVTHLGIDDAAVEEASRRILRTLAPASRPRGIRA
jgi:threonine aldolase